MQKFGGTNKEYYGIFSHWPLAYKSQNLCLRAGQNDRSSEVECALKKPTDFRDNVSSFKFHNC